MRGALKTAPKVLLCNAYRRFADDYLDYIGENVYGVPRISNPRRIGFGLRFLKQNVPEIEILEYPMWPEYVERLKEGWDVVGFSFFQNEIAEVERMADEARRHGVREIWAGGHGALDGHVAEFCDRVFSGAAEDQVAQAFGYRVRDEEVEHPSLMMPFRFKPGSIPYLMLGLLYTERGCPFRCTFCQTPAYEDRRFTVNFESVERVVKHYRKVGIKDVFVMDELFGTFPAYADKLSELFARYGLRWWSQSRAGIYLRNLETWYERGLRFPVIGLETMKQGALDSIDKKQKVEEIMEFSRKTREKGDMYRMVYYMIGYEGMTAEQTLEDAALVKKAGFDAHQVNVLTPFPKTPLWDDIRMRYGITDTNYRHYSAKHLVWNHPHISAAQMRYLLNAIIAYLNRPRDIYFKGFARLIRERFARHGLGFIWDDILKSPVVAAVVDDRKQVFFPKMKHDKV